MIPLSLHICSLIPQIFIECLLKAQPYARYYVLDAEEVTTRLPGLAGKGHSRISKTHVKLLEAPEYQNI